MTVDWQKGLTPAQIRDAEMRRGADVIIEKHGAAEGIVAALFDPEFEKQDRRSQYAKDLAKKNAKRWENNDSGQ